jgi:membrane protease YdiL (CAAX protease family)
MSALLRRYPLTSFFMLAYAFAWAAWIPIVFSARGIGLFAYTAPIEWLIPGTFGPFIAAAIVQRFGLGRWRIGPLFAPGRAFLSGAAVGTVAIVVAWLLLPTVWLSGIDAPRANWHALLDYPAAIALAAFQAGPIGEEPGWRGFALPHLQARHHPLVAAAVLGVLWAMWHLPLFLLEGWSSVPVTVYVVLVVAFTIILGTATNLAGGSIMVAILLHAAFNGWPRILGQVLAGTPIHPPLPLSSGTVMAAAGAFVALVLVLITRGQLAAPRLPGDMRPY